MSGKTVRIRLEPWSIEIEVPEGTALMGPLSASGIEFPCGGSGICGGCGVRVLSGSLPVSMEDRAVFKPDEISSGWRLACQARAEESMVLECGLSRIEILSDDTVLSADGKRGLGIAIDLGTTTIAAQLIDLASGCVLSVRTALNPQLQAGADVMSRIRAVLLGVDLTSVIRNSLGSMVVELAGKRARDVCEVVIVGNTVMHHLFSGLDIEPLAYAPFVTPHLGTQHFTPEDLGWPLAKSCAIRFEACIGSFVGSDARAGVIATGMAHGEELAALIDLGTNGEIVIGNRDGMVCASTAAGPAFEAGCIRMGMRAAPGAIAHVALENGRHRVSVIGEGEPRGICGSGAVDAIAVGLESGAILPSGRVTDGTKIFPVADGVALYQSDIREVQLAKAAIAAGVRLLLDRLGLKSRDLKTIYLSGAFGNYVRIPSAIRIGLIEVPEEWIHAAGNTALRGAKMMLLARNEPVLPAIEHVCLTAVEGFQDRFVTAMSFPPAEQTQPVAGIAAH